MHHCPVGLQQRRIPPCHSRTHLCFFGAICGSGPITSLLYERAVAAFNRGDYDTIAALGVIGFQDTNDKELFHRVMVAERNAAWIPKLRNLFDGGNVVVVVGASHFPGNDGLIALLQENGYQVEPIRLPEDK